MYFTKYLLLLCLLNCTLAFGQVKTGFQYLKSEKNQQAAQIFELNMNEPKYAAAANYGLARVYAATMPEIEDCFKAYEQIEKARSLAKDMDSKKKSKQIKQGWLPKDNFNAIQRKVLNTLAEKLDETEDLAVVNQVLDFEEASETRRFSGKIKTSLKQARQRAVAKSLREATDYPSLQSLATRHRQIVIQNNFLLSKNLDQRLINAFISSYGEAEIARFAKENPAHYISQDCWIDEYIAAVKQPDIAGMLDFIHDYPLSVLSQLAFWWLEDRIPSASERSGFTERQNRQIAMLGASRPLSNQLTFGLKLSEHFQEEAIAFIKQAAPTTKAYYFMQAVLQRYLKEKQWDLAEDLSKRCQPLFPDKLAEDCNIIYNYYLTKQRWFNTAIPILERPAQGIGMTSLEALNTIWGDEYSPVISADGTSLYFAGAGRKDNINGEDIFVAHLKDGEWSSPILVPNLSGQANFVPLSLTADGRQMLVFQDGKLHISSRTTTGWSKAEAIPGVSDVFPWVGAAVFAENGWVLILSASKEIEDLDQLTDTDIFVAIKNKLGKWDAPFSIGTTINTSKQERSPFLHADGFSLYFSSNGHDGLGEMDVYSSKRLDDSWTNWSAPTNMGKEINTLEDEMGYNYAISASGKSTYLAMRDNKHERYDLYATDIPKFVEPQPQTVIILQLEQQGNGLLPLIVKDAEGNIIGNAISHPSGKVELVVPQNAKGPFSVSTPSSSKAFIPFLISPNSLSDQIIIQQPIEVFDADALCQGSHLLQTRGILFDKNAHTLSPETETEMAAIFSLLDCPQPPFIEIAGFSDPDGSEKDNLILSQKRAEAVQKFLITKGYPEQRIVAKGYGVKEIATNKELLTEAEKAECRKVEIRIAGVKKE